MRTLLPHCTLCTIEILGKRILLGKNVMPYFDLKNVTNTAKTERLASNGKQSELNSGT